MNKKLLCVTLIALLDAVVTTFLFIHGNKWFIFEHSIDKYAFATSFFEFPLLAYLRSSILLGSVIGILKNPIEGPKRCKASFWAICAFACINFYYACLKLLVYSEDSSFVAGKELYMFWAMFVWTLVASVLCSLQWGVLLSTSKLTNLDGMQTCAKMDNPETEPLLNKVQPSATAGTVVLVLQALWHAKPIVNTGRKGHDADDFFHGANGNYASINESKDVESCSLLNSTTGLETEYSISSSSDYQAVPSVTQKPSNKSKDKGYDELLNKVTLGTMLSYSIPDWPYITAALVFLTISSVAQIFLPLYTGKVVAAIVVERKSQNDFTKNIIIMGLISLVASLFGGMRGGTFMLVIQKLNIRVRNALFSSITSQEIGFFDKMKTGEITSRLTSDTTTMSDTVGLNCNIFVRNVIQAIGICVFMFSLSWRMSILTFMGLPLVLGVSELYGKYYKKLQKQAQDKFAIANEVADEVCSSMQTVRSFANEKDENERYNSKLLDVYEVLKKQCFFYAGYVWTTQTIELMLTVATLWYGGHLLLTNVLTAEHFISFILYQQTLGECFSEIGEVYTGLMQALGAAEKVFELIKRKPTISTEDGKEEPGHMRGKVSFQNVCFSYPGRPDQPVLQDVSFDVNPGEVVALVGPSGGGKSSCVKLLERFYDPTSGSVLIDDKPVRSYDHKFLHEKVSLVGQEPILYARSLSSNILYGLDDSRFDHSDVVKAAMMANAHQFIMELPDKYDTEAGEKGAQLSGGQKQRVAIARAIVRNPSVLLLDEATSALDTESEFLVQEALERSKSDRTVLLIAHRLSTVERADRIVVVVKGRVQEIGSHCELMEKHGTYYKLVHRQLHSSARQSNAPVCVDASMPQEIASSLRRRCSGDDQSSSSSGQSSYGSFKINI